MGQRGSPSALASISNLFRRSANPLRQQRKSMNFLVLTVLIWGVLYRFRIPAFSLSSRYDDLSTAGSLLLWKTGEGPTTERKKKSSNILAQPMGLLRRGIPLDSMYNFASASPALGLHNGGVGDGSAATDRECSCRNPKASGSCCARIVRRNHKMGYVLVASLFQNATNVQLSQGAKAANYLETNLLSKKKDFRVVLVVRDIYEALVSGYLVRVFATVAVLKDLRCVVLALGLNSEPNVLNLLPLTNSSPDSTIVPFGNAHSIIEGIRSQPTDTILSGT